MNSRLKNIVYALALITFCFTVTAASAAELQLAGIKLGRPAITILQKYGNPAEIRIGSTTQASTTASTGASGAMMMPGGMPGMPGAMSTMPGGMPGMPGMPGAMTMPGGMPGMPGAMTMPGGMPGMPGSPGAMTAPGTTAGTTTQTATKATEVTWVYKFSKNRTLEFVINPQGRILQIAAFGAEWPGVNTALGIKLGNTYKEIIRKYGWPESHEAQGSNIVIKYPDKHRVLFTMSDQTVVGITIALMD